MDKLLDKLANLETTFADTEVEEDLDEAAKKKKKPYSSETVTTGSIPLNIDRFNKAMGTAPIEPEATDVAEIEGFLSAGGGCDAGDCGGGMCESAKTPINEDTLYISKTNTAIVLPEKIKLVPKAEVSKLLKQVKTGDRIGVGYITSLHTYGALDDFCKILKCTEFIGTSAIDWADSEQLLDPEDDNKFTDDKDFYISGAQSVDYTIKNVAVHQQTVKLSAIEKEKEKAELIAGGMSPAEAEKVATAHQAEKEKAATVYKPSRSETLDTILYYPDPSCTPVVRYYVDIVGLDLGYCLVDRHYLYEQIIKRVKAAAKRVAAEVASAKTKAERKPLESKYNKYMRLLSFDSQRKISDALCLDAATSGEESLESQWGVSRQADNELMRPQVRALYTNQIYYIKTDKGSFGDIIDNLDDELLTLDDDGVEESLETTETPVVEAVAPLVEKRETKRYYVRPQDIFCANKADVLKALIDVSTAGENCTVYTLKNLSDHDDVHKLTNDDIIYYYDKDVLYDKNHVMVMDYDLFIKHEEERGKVSDTGKDLTKTEWNTEYDDRMTQNTVVESIEAPVDDNPFNLTFESYDAYGRKLVEGKVADDTCVICGEDYEGPGNNAEPYATGYCCDACNLKFVIPARQVALENTKEDNE